MWRSSSTTLGLARRHRHRPGIELVERVPQAHKVALTPLADGRCRSPLRYGHRLCGRGHPGRRLGQGRAPRRCPRRRRLDGSAAGDAPCAARSAARWLYLRGLSQPRRLASARATCSRSPPRCSACPASSSMPCERIRTELLPRYPNVDGVVGLDHIYGCGVAIDAPDAPIPIRTLRNISRNPELRRRDDGGRASAARNCSRSGLFGPMPSRRARTDGIGRRHAAGSSQCRFRGDDRLDPGARPKRISRGSNRRRRDDLPGVRSRRRHAVRRQRRIFRHHGQSGAGLCRRSAGAGGRHGHVLGEHRGARRHRPADRARRDARRRRAHHRRARLVRPLSRARRRRPQRQHHARQQEGRAFQYRREGDGLDRQVGHCADRRRVRRASGPAQRACSTPRRRRAISSAARCRWPPA